MTTTTDMVNQVVTFIYAFDKLSSHCAAPLLNYGDSVVVCT